MPAASRARQLLLGASLILIAFNLRPVFGSLSVLLPEVMKDTGLSPAGASLLTTLPLLFFSSARAGAGIAVANVLLPGLVKRDFPARAAMMTGLYTLAVCAGASGSTAFTVPLEQHLFDGEWPHALAAWALPALAVLVLWAPQVPAFAPRRCCSWCWAPPWPGAAGARAVACWYNDVLIRKD